MRSPPTQPAPASGAGETKGKAMRRLILTAILGAVTLLAVACGGHRPSPQFSAPPTTAAERADFQKGLNLVESCIPNGHTVVTTVRAGTASGLTYLQLTKFVVKDHGVSRVWDCISTKPGPVPAAQMKAALEKCSANKVTPIIEADHHVIRDRRQIAPAVVNAMAVCAGRYAS